MRFAGEVAVITGAASGIGLATARRLVAEGAQVLSVDRDAAGLAEAPGSTMVADMAEDSTPAAVAKAAMDRFGRLDMLVNNAGVGGSKSLELTDDALIDRMLGINLRAVMRMTREALRVMARPGGRIVNVASIYGEVGFPGSAAYAASKGGVAQLTRQLAADLSPVGIRVNAVSPGCIETAMTAKRIATDEWYQRAQIATTPAGRIGRPEDVAGAIAFLLSADADFIAGHVLAVDGGWLGARICP